MSPTHKQNVLRAYRELIDLIYRMPAAEKAKSLAEARATVGTNPLMNTVGWPHIPQKVKARKAEPNALAASDMLREMYEHISFLRVITPRRPRDRLLATGSVTYVVRDGDLVEGVGDVKGKRCVGAH